MKPTQEEWDAKLVDCFYHHKDAPMYRLLDGLHIEEFNGLLRIPRIRQLNMCVTAFISQYIPKLGKKLWELDASKIPNVLAALKGSKLDTLKGNSDVVKERNRIRHAEKNDLERIALISGKRRAYNAKANGRDWNTCS